MTEKTTKGWTPERRAAARERILKNKPWEKSTGPRTERGKEASSLNAVRHGRDSAETKYFLRILKGQEAYARNVRIIQRLRKVYRAEYDRERLRKRKELMERSNGVSIPSVT